MEADHIAYPEWTDYRDKGGLDPLGMQNSSINLYQRLLPGISNVTLRMRYHGLLCLACRRQRAPFGQQPESMKLVSTPPRSAMTASMENSLESIVIIKDLGGIGRRELNRGPSPQPTNNTLTGTREPTEPSCVDSGECVIPILHKEATS
jgi:hypothetical protein